MPSKAWSSSRPAATSRPRSPSCSRGSESDSRRCGSPSPSGRRSAPAVSSSCRPEVSWNPCGLSRSRPSSMRSGGPRPSPTPSTRRSCEERFVGRTEAELAWWIERTFRESGAEGLAFGTIVASGENGARPHAHAGDSIIEAGTLVTDRHGMRRRRLLLRLHPDVRDRAAVAAAHRALPAGRSRHSSTASPPCARAQAAATSTQRRERRSPRRGSPRLRARSRSRSRSRGPRGADAATGVDRRARPGKRRHRRAGLVRSGHRGLPHRGSGRRHRDGCEILTSFTKELIVVA